VANDVAKAKRQLFIFIDQYLIIITTLMVQMFSMHTKNFETKTFLPKTGNIYSVVLSFPNLALKYHSDISISKKITLALPTYIQIFH
jgi:hypothetical protein